MIAGSLGGVDGCALDGGCCDALLGHVLASGGGSWRAAVVRSRVLDAVREGCGVSARFAVLAGADTGADLGEVAGVEGVEIGFGASPTTASVS